MMLTTEIERLALMAHALRPDWPAKALRTFVANQLADHSYQDAAVAFAFVACDPQTETPARILAAGPWWKATRQNVEHLTDQPKRFSTEPIPDQSRNAELRDQIRKQLEGENDIIIPSASDEPQREDRDEWSSAPASSSP